ncbi:MAG: tail fiber domain-containing protein, partial [Candidatus Woesearchaeota archaeon]
LAVTTLITALLLVPLVIAANPGHPAEQISPGTFGSGNYVFPSQLTIQGNFIIDTDTFYVDQSTGRVGIGTDEPDHPLHVIGNGYFTGAVRVATPVDNNHATTKNYVDTTTVGLIGDQTIGGTKTFTSSVEIDTSGAAELILRGNERGSIGQGAFTDGLGNTANNDDTWIRTRFRGSAGNFNLNTVFRDAGGITMYGPNSSGVIWNINTSGQLTTGNVPWARLSGHPTITAGDGLSGGGSLNTNRTISVDSTVVRTSGNQTIGGNKRFNELTGFGVAPSTIWRIYSRSSSNSVYIRTDSSSSGVYALRVRSGANSTALTVMGNARVGIGTSSPTESLHVIGRVRLGSQANATTHAVRADRTISTGSGLSGGGNLTANRTFSVDGTVVRTSGNQTIAGTKTFSGLIDATRSTSAGSFSADLIQIGTTSGNRRAVFRYYNHTDWDNQSYFEIRPKNNATSEEKIYVMGNGRTGIGIVPGDVSGYNPKLHIHTGNDITKGILLDTGIRGGIIGVDDGGPGGSGGIIGRLFARLIRTDTGAGSGGVHLLFGHTSWSSASDKTLKENITKINHALKKLEKINGYYYDWKNEDSGTKKYRHVGLIAQEVEKVLPEAVSTDKKDNLKSIRYTEIIPLLVQAIKEQQEQINYLLNKVN